MLLINDKIDIPNIEEVIESLPQQRRDQVLAIKSMNGQRTSAAAYLLLCEGLERGYGIKEMPVFIYNEHGKPRLKDYPHIHFNMSHCKCAAICAIDNVPVGVDIETIRPYNRRLAQYTMNSKELAIIESSDTPEIEFIRLWTRKEAVAKMIGRGLNNIKGLLDCYSGEIETIANIDKGYIYSVCKDKD